MLHFKFRGYRPTASGEGDSLRVFKMYGRGGDLSHVTKIPRIHFHYPYTWRLYIKFQLDWPSSFRDEDL